MRRYQKENNCDGIFLQETNCTDKNSLGNFKHWKGKMNTIYKSKNTRFGVGTFISISTKNVFREDYTNDLDKIWNEMNIQNIDVLIGNIYVKPRNKNQLKILVKELERHRGKSIIVLGDFNSRSNTRDKNMQHQNRMRQLLEDIIKRLELYIITELPYTFKRSSNTGKSTVDLTFVRGLKKGYRLKLKNLSLSKVGI